MLTRFRGKRRKLQFLAYDLEWTPHTMEQRLVGVYDGRRYRSYPDTTAFLRAELTHKNRGKVFFAHAGGMADIQFVLEAIIKRANPAFRVKGHWSGSSLVICTISAGKNNWTFADSYWLFRDKLSKIGKSLGLEKGGQDYHCSNFPECGHEHKGTDKCSCDQPGKPTCIFYAPTAVLADYNALDCRILYLAVERMQDEVWALGGMQRMTIASTGMALLRCSFLKRDIPTSEALNRVAREAYIASRVEVIQRNCGPANYFDINSSFPWSMTKPQPGRLLGTSKRWVEGEAMAMIRATVNVPPCYIPPLPMRVDDRVFFPTGVFTRWFMGEDLSLLLDVGGKIESVHEVMHFEPFDDLCGYVSTIYELRRKTTDDFQKLVYKYLMNCVYGKFGEGTEKSGLLINPEKRPPEEEITRQYGAGLFAVKKEVDVKHAHVPISANITASSRAIITRHLIAAAKQGKVYYCDTDSIVTTQELPTSDALGGLKREEVIESGTFLAPKLYRLFPGPKIRAKGFRGLTGDEFDSLAAGDPVEIERMVRIRENYARGEFSPREAIYQKRTLGHLTAEELREIGVSEASLLRPKRALESDHNTRPWEYKELVCAS